MCFHLREISRISGKRSAVKLLWGEQYLNIGKLRFRSKHSYEGVLLKINDEWLRYRKEDQTVVAVFLDFKRAFETINKLTLLNNFRAIGIKFIVLKWFRSYLSNRTECVKWGNVMSSTRNNFRPYDVYIDLVKLNALLMTQWFMLMVITLTNFSN